MRALRLLVLRRLRLAPARAAVTVVAIAAGVSLTVSISILLTSIDRSLEDFGSGLAGPAPLRVTGATLRGGLPEEALDRAAGVEGVTAVVPMVQTPGLVQPEPGADPKSVLVVGVDCRVESLVGTFGCDPGTVAATTGALGVSEAIELAPDSVLRTDLGRLPLTGASVLEGFEAGGAPAVVLPLPVAQAHFTRLGTVDVGYVLVDPSADLSIVEADLQDAVGAHLPVLRAEAPPPGAAAVLGGALPMYSILGVFALGIGGVLVSNVSAMSLEARRRELAVLAAVGGRARTVVGATVAEMAVLGVAGGLLGALGGAVVATPIVRSLSAFTEDVAGVPLRVHLGAGSVVTGIGLGVLVAVAAALVPARRASRMEVAAELSGREPADRGRPARFGRRVAAWATVAIVGAVGCQVAPLAGGLEPWQPALVAPSFLLVTMGALFASSAAAPLLVGAMARLDGGRTSAPWRLALAAARRDHRRTSVLAITLGAAVATAFVTEGASAGARASVEQNFEAIGPGVDVASVPQGRGTGAYLEPGVLDGLAQVPGVDRVDVGRFVLAGEDDLVLVQAVTENPLALEVIDGDADPERLAAGEVLIGAGLARQDQVRPGDEIQLTTPSGPVAVPVQGVWADGNNVGVNVTMSPALLEELYGPQPADYVVARPAPGVEEATLRDRIVASGLDPDLRARVSASVADDIAREIDEQFASFRVMQQALVGVLFVAVLSSLLLAGVQRRRELGLLAAIGAEPPGIAAALLAETVVVSVVGLASAAGAAPMMAWALNRLLPFVVGWANPLVLDWSAFLTAGLVAVAVALVGAAWPALRAGRVEVLDALRYE